MPIRVQGPPLRPGVAKTRAKPAASLQGSVLARWQGRRETDVRAGLDGRGFGDALGPYRKLFGVDIYFWVKHLLIGPAENRIEHVPFVQVV